MIKKIYVCDSCGKRTDNDNESGWIAFNSNGRMCAYVFSGDATSRVDFTADPYFCCAECLIDYISKESKNDT